MEERDLAGRAEWFSARRWALVHGQLALNTGRSVSLDGMSAERCYLYLSHTMASQSAGIGSEPMSLTAELPTLATAMKSAPPTGEGTGEWEYGAKERGCTKNRCKMLFVVLCDDYTLLNNRYLTKWFRGVGHTGSSKYFWHFWLFGPISFQIFHLFHLWGTIITVLTESVLNCVKKMLFSCLN